MASSPLFFLYYYNILCFLLTLFSVSHSSIVLLPLTHSLSKTQHNSTTHHLLKSTSSRSAARFLRHHHHHRQVSLPLSSGSDYTLSLTLATTPPQPVSLYMDTGSDLVWFPCSPFECILCEGKSNPSTTLPPPKLPQNATVSCHSPACAAAHSSHSSSDLCAIARCPLDSIETSDCSNFSCPPFYYAYADGSLVARLHKYSFSITPSLLLNDFTFGCAHTALGEPIGVAGFGQGLLSMPAQLAKLSPQLGQHFSYCLVSHSFDSERVRKPSPLILGRKEKRVEGEERVEFVYTTMIDNPKHPYFYSVGFLGISVGKRNIPGPEFLRRVDRRGGGGMVVDSGTTFTMLPASFYDSVVAEFDRRVGRAHERATEIEDKTGLTPCYFFDDNKVIVVPTMTLHFLGGDEKKNKSSGVVLPRRNYFYEFLDGDDAKKRKVGCLMLMNGGDEKELSGGPGATLGNYQQQGFEVAYDLENRRVGFARRQCSSLWDSLNQ
ncbi:Aspartic proteinase nepenthesin-2 [Morus notabilis]|uniref:Aspartic proteinase nepenthesin-2 n=1 Tax=Morus notabilis TaxID=981085 RepID=W9SGX1_9ROSA|nr:probable aspartyl protease At4g16563 [Morus notabilis]EXC28303.1 Aspartic proteinase nepenthesin-2 [Morus notabilis]